MTINEKIKLLVTYKNKEIRVSPYENLELLEALNRTLDTALILMKLIEQKGESNET